MEIDFWGVYRVMLGLWYKSIDLQVVQVDQHGRRQVVTLTSIPAAQVKTQEFQGKSSELMWLTLIYRHFA